jgi:hypothetical protein
MSYRKRMRKMKQLAEKILPLDKKSQLYINGKPVNEKSYFFIQPQNEEQKVEFTIQNNTEWIFRVGVLWVNRLCVYECFIFCVGNNHLKVYFFMRSIPFCLFAQSII